MPARRARRALITTFLVALALAGPSHAGLYNAHPANAFGDPIDVIYDNEALFAYTMSDIKGGYVCIVHANAPPGATCSAAAWGTKNRVVGIGTQFTLIEGGNLVPGHWRLQTVDSEGQNGDIGGEFTVIPCDPAEHPDQCTTSLSADAVANAKRKAGDVGTPLAAACIGAAVKDIAGAGAAARSSLKKLKERHRNYVDGTTGFRATVYPLLPGMMGLSFSLPSFGNPGEEKAKAILKDLVCSLTEMYADIAADPPDPAFTTIAQPSFAVLPPDADALLESIDRQTSYGETMLKAFERYQGAQLEGSHTAPYQHGQAGAMGRFGLQQVAQMRASVEALRAEALELDANPDFAGPVATAEKKDQLVEVYRRVQLTGFTPQELADLMALGLTTEQIEDARTQFDLDPSVLPVDTTLQSILLEAATAIEDAIPAFDALARTASVVAGRTNTAPIASFDASPLSGAPPLTVTFQSTSTSTDLDSLTYAWDFGDGATATGASATHTYTAPGNYEAALTVSDGLASHTATRTISVGVEPPPNRPPVANDDVLVTYRNTAGTVDVVQNDTDPDGDPLRLATTVAYPAHGSVVCDRDAGTCTYTPSFGYTGPDSFEYSVADDESGYDSATVSVTVLDTPNNPPVAVDDTLVVERDRDGVLSPLANDSDPDGDTLSIVSWTQPANGSSTCASARCWYTPTAGYYGPDSFTYTASDGRGGVATGTVTVTVDPNRAPVAAFDSFRIAQDTAATLNVVENDRDADGDPLELVSWTQPGDGSASCTAAGSCTYTPDAGFTGFDSFEYTIRDPQGKTSSAPVSLHVVDPLEAGADWVWRRGRALEFEPTIQDPSNVTHTCSWTFGDGTPAAAGCAFDHVYAAPGSYDAVVTVSFTNGSTLTDGVNIRVLGPEPADRSDEELGAGVIVPGTDVTYSTSEEFDRGTLLNVNHDSPADQLQLNTRAKPFPFVNMAASNRGTIVRIAADTGDVMGEYRTAPDGMARNPSRTTVDQLGNVWVANRDESSESNGLPRGSVARVGLVIGGTRVNAAGEPTPDGKYLAPPFRYSTCVDRDDDGRLFTSGGLEDIRAWTNEGEADSHGGVSTAADECIINYTRVRGTGTRSIAVDAKNDVWVSGTGNNAFEKLDGATGQPVPGTQFNLGCGGYGALIDGRGVLWGATAPLRYDTATRTGSCLALGGYGIAVDPATNHVWMSGGGQALELDPAGGLLNTYGHGFGSSQGLAVDGSGNVWVTHSLGGSSVGRLRTDGTLVGAAPTDPGPTGVAVDTRGKVWAANISGSAQRIDPAIGRVGGAGLPSGWVDLTVDLGKSSGPYNYSDMTGFVSLGTTSRSGFWRVVQDAGAAGADWSRIGWNRQGGGTIEVEARAADQAAALAEKPFAAVGNNVRLDLKGRLIEVRATLRAPDAGAGPVLTDLRIRANRAPTAAGGAVTVDQDVPKSVVLSGADADDDTLTYEIIAGPAHGDLSTGTGPTRTYTPHRGYSGPDAFTYRTSDGRLTSAPATVQITVVAAPVQPQPQPSPPPPAPPPPPPVRDVLVDGIRCSIVGTPGADVLRGTAKDDVICGLAGDDVLYGLGGNDILFGGEGSDRLYGGAGNDLARGSPGADTIVGEAGNDRLDGGLGDDRILGGGGNDTLRGRSGVDLLDGGAGLDKLDGHEGDDRLLGGGDKDRILGGPGADRLDAGTGADNVLLGEGGNDFLIAKNGKRDRLSGGPGNDRARVDPLLDLASFIEQLLR